MMHYTFKTKSIIPIDAFTTFGLSAKENDNPIGRFGTGLKYAVATILRLGGTIEVWIEGVRHVFYLKEEDFRNKTFSMVRMKKANGWKWQYIRLPFTTELGKDWQLWQAYRELESNTRDEDGESFAGQQLDPSEGTVITIYHDDLKGIVNDTLNPVFLPEAEMTELVVYSDSLVTIYDRPSNHLYFRGIRVYTPRTPSRLTYNFKKYVELTEDRTIANIWTMEYHLTTAIRDRITDDDLLEKILKKDVDSYETHDLGLFNQRSNSSKFDTKVSTLRNRGTLGRAGGLYYSSYLERPTVSLRTLSLPAKTWSEMAEVLRHAGREDLASQLDIG